MTETASEVTALALALGVLFSLICYLVTNLSPGGMITPGWIALILVEEPRRALLIAGVVVCTYLIVRLLEKVVILYGKRLFATVVMAAVFIQITLFLFLIRPFPQLFGFTTLGFIVPGLVAYQLIRQPIIPTIVATATVSSIAYTLILSGVLLRLVPARAELAGLETITSASLTPLRLGAAAGVAVAGLLLLAWQLRKVSRPEMAGAVSVWGNGEGHFDPLGYITASRRGDQAAGGPLESPEEGPSDPIWDDEGEGE